LRHTTVLGRDARPLECCRSAVALDTLRAMRARHASVLAAVLLAAACGGDGGSAPGRGDYFAQLERVSQNAHIQDRGLRRDLRVRIGKASGGEDRLTALVVFSDQSARLYEDVVDALRALEPEEEVGAAHQAYVAAWQSRLELVVKVRDAGFASPGGYLEALEGSAFTDATAEIRRRCEELEEAAAAIDEEVDLACRGRPA
jgi:hypothetical protein